MGWPWGGTCWCPGVCTCVVHCTLATYLLFVTPNLLQQQRCWACQDRAMVSLKCPQMLHRRSIAGTLHAPALALHAIAQRHNCRQFARRQGASREDVCQQRHWGAHHPNHRHTQRCAATLQQRHHVPTATATADVQPSTPAVSNSFWQWREHTIRYQQCGTQGPAVLLIHGFGANWCVCLTCVPFASTTAPTLQQ